MEDMHARNGGLFLLFYSLEMTVRFQVLCWVLFVLLIAIIESKTQLLVRGWSSSKQWQKNHAVVNHKMTG
jgi:hypothetical protein